MTEETKGGISRRTLAKGMAWSIPAVAVASTVPAYAASPPPPPIDPSAGSGPFCQHSNVNRYHGEFCFNNTTAAPITVTLTSWVVPGGHTLSAFFSESGVLNSSRSMPPGETCWFVDSSASPDNANGLSTLFFSYEFEGDTIDDSIEATASGVNCNSTPPAPTGAPPHTPGGP